MVLRWRALSVVGWLRYRALSHLVDNAAQPHSTDNRQRGAAA